MRFVCCIDTLNCSNDSKTLKFNLLFAAVPHQSTFSACIWLLAKVHTFVTSIFDAVLTSTVLIELWKYL